MAEGQTRKSDHPNQAHVDAALKRLDFSAEEIEKVRKALQK